MTRMKLDVRCLCRILDVLLGRVEHTEFSQRHQECDEALQLWIIEATRSAELMRQYAGRILTADETDRLHKQQAQASCALVTYLALRRALHAELKTEPTGISLLYGRLPGILP